MLAMLWLNLWKISLAKGSFRPYTISQIPPRLKKLTDRILTRWYLHHYHDDNDMPFGHDISDPFSLPFIKFHKPTKAEVNRIKQKRN
jgi:hypothetical protein